METKRVVNLTGRPLTKFEKKGGAFTHESLYRLMSFFGWKGITLPKKLTLCAVKS